MNADRIAPYYQALEYLRFGRTLERVRSAMLGHLTDRKKALVLGDGDARFLNSFISHVPGAKVDTLDLSERMLQLAQRRLRMYRHPAADVRFHHADIRTAPLPDTGYDLIATHFFLDVFTEAELRSWIARVTRASAKGALWVISEFDLPVGGWRRTYAAAWLAIMYKAFRLTTGLATQRLPDWRPILQENGFRPLHALRFRNGFLVSELWEHCPHHQQTI
jgi:ubiquinone/menaquinone biosynthesis C-methylase UbiE